MSTLPELLVHVLGQIALGTEIVLVSTRPVDLHDDGRFAAFWSHAAARDWVRHIQCLDVQSDEFAEFFIAE